MRVRLDERSFDMVLAKVDFEVLPTHSVMLFLYCWIQWAGCLFWARCVVIELPPLAELEGAWNVRREASRK